MSQSDLIALGMIFVIVWAAIATIYVVCRLVIHLNRLADGPNPPLCPFCGEPLREIHVTLVGSDRQIPPEARWICTSDDHKDWMFFADLASGKPEPICEL